MEKADLDMLIRIKDTVSEISNLAVKLVANDNRIRGATDQYRNYYDLVKPIIDRYKDYVLEFQALHNKEQVGFGNVTPSFVAFRSFLEGVIKQESLSTQTAIEEIKKELFIDENKPFTAYRAILDIVNKTTSSLKIVDNYLESTSLDFFSNINSKAEIEILTAMLKPNHTNFKISLNKFMAEWGGKSIDIKISNYFHDRYIIIDNIEVWHVGPSLNRLGIKPAMISRIDDVDITKHILFLFDSQWKVASVIS